MKKNNDFFPEVDSSGDSSDFSMEVLYEDSFEDRPLDDDYSWDDDAHKHKHRHKHKHGKHKRHRSSKRWKKVLLGLIAIIVVGIAGLTGGFFYLRAQGEKHLKTNVAAAGDSAEAQEGLYITYKDKKYQYNEDVINFLCLGIAKDVPIEEKTAITGLETGGEGFADAVILISLNVKSGQIKIFAIPRDTIVPVKVVDSAGYFVRTENIQLTAQHAYGQTATEGAELMVDAVSNLLYKVPIQRYCSINLAAIPILNDAIGGVDVQVLEDISGPTGTYRAGETIHLEGEMARDYVQQRDTGIYGSSLKRLEREKQYMTNYFATAKEAVKKDMSLPLTLYQNLQPNMCTNITVEDIAYLVPELLDITLNGEDMMTIPGEATWGEYLEYNVNTEQLKEIVINNVYKEIP